MHGHHDPTIDTTIFQPVRHWHSASNEQLWDDSGSFSEREIWPWHTGDGDPFAYTVPCTGWGDQLGDDITRSNYRSLLRDYPDVCKSVDGMFDSHHLIVREHDLLADDGFLYDLLHRLATEYPLYDEQDQSELEIELVEEAWDLYLEHDLVGEINDAIGRDDVDAGACDRAWLKDMFNELTSQFDEWPYAESAVSVVFPHMEETVDALVPIVLAQLGK